ncbi:MAG: SufE family protein, partial [Verrucomicrobia bacterium]|nr:SufE family protein [Verrucomicrobiota bacterium]
VKIYSGESPETILKCPPSYIEELGILRQLTPGRANGLASLYLRMKQEAARRL